MLRINLPRKSEIGFLLLGIVFLFPLFKISFNSYVLIIWSIGSVFLNWNIAKSKLKNQGAIILMAILPFLIMTASLFYSADLEHGLEKVTQSIPILLAPLIVFLFYKDFTRKEINLYCIIFTCACIIHAAYLNFEFFTSGGYSSIQEIKFYDNPFRSIVHELQWGDLHPTYVSLWYAFSCSFLIMQLRPKSKPIKVMALIAAILVLVVTLLLLSSKTGILALIIVFVINLIFLKSKVVKSVLMIVFTGCLLSGIFFTPLLKSRFVDEFMATEMKPPVGKGHNSINLRVGIYQCTSQIIKENPFFGSGIGDVQASLNNCFDRYDTDAYKIKNYNSHSYYLHVLLFGGIIGFILFFLPFVTFFKVALSQKDVAYVSFLTLIFCFMFTENILSRNHGILFFALFNTIFLNYHNKYVNRIIGNLPQFKRQID